jgi:hypothetical protein
LPELTTPSVSRHIEKLLPQWHIRKQAKVWGQHIFVLCQSSCVMIWLSVYALELVVVYKEVDGFTIVSAFLALCALKRQELYVRIIYPARAK